MRAGYLDKAILFTEKSRVLGGKAWNSQINDLAMRLINAELGKVDDAKKLRRELQCWVEQTAKNRAVIGNRANANNWLEFSVLLRECDELLMSPEK